MMASFAKPYSHLSAGIAVAVLLFFLGTLLPFVPATRDTILIETTVSRFASVTPRSVAVSCSCVSCPGHTGGKCCCGGAGSPSEALAFRAVCDNVPDAVLPSSPLPPILLPERPLFAVGAVTSAPVASWRNRVHARIACPSPLPPDVPPRSCS